MFRIKNIKKHNEMQIGEGGKENAITIKFFRQRDCKFFKAK
jgi:hypothetical protein